MSTMAQVEVVRAACCIAAMDGEFAEPELKLIQKLADRVGIGKASLDAIILRSKSDPAFFEQQFRIVRADAKSTMKSLFAVAIADRDLAQEERIMLHHFAEKLGLPEADFNRILEAAETAMKGLEK